MNFNIFERLQEYQKEKEQSNKNNAKLTLAQNISKISSTAKINTQLTVDSLKGDIGKNAQRIKMKSTITNIQLSPTKRIKSPKQFRSPTAMASNNQYRSPMGMKNSQIDRRSSPQKRYTSRTIEVPFPIRVMTPREDLKNSQLKLYSTKYQKVLNEEQGAYYSLLQTKLDQLQDMIGQETNQQHQMREIENVINKSKQTVVKTHIQRQVDNLQSEKRALQTDLQNITYKISRFTDITDI